ncbi:MAG: hypothetical protein D6791_18085 [Chloroflexi bacterium]|nr:MAG: hypothetical protein D6791_18085 [Chloroflexota bacterium]
MTMNRNSSSPRDALRRPNGRQFGWVLLLLGIVWLLAACGGGSTEATPSPVPAVSEVTPEATSGALSVLATPAVSLLPTPTPFAFPQDPDQITVAPGKAVVIGRLISMRTGTPLPNTVVRLAEVYYADENNKSPETGAYALDNAFSPSAITDDQGYFIFQDVDPRDYVIFVGDIMVNYTVDVNEKGFPRVRTAEPESLPSMVR